MRLTTILFSATLLALVSCGGGESSDTSPGNENAPLTGDVRIDGSSTVYPITEAIAEEYRSEESKVKVTVGVSGTGGGFKKFSRGETDINDASRSIKDKEIKACTEAGIDYLELSVAYDGLAVIANPQNDWLESITVEELKMIWEPAAQTNVTHWNQIRAEWPAEEIHLFGPGVASGTYDYFTEVICGQSGASRGDYTASEDDNVLVQGISTDKYGLGFFGLAYYQENKDKLKLISVDNGTGPILPSLQTVADGSYAPLSRPIFIYVNSNAAARPEVQSFVTFYMENAGSITEEVGYIPLPAAEYSTGLSSFLTFAGIPQ